MKNKTYRVVWEIDSEAATPLEAAKEAFRHMQTPGTSANFFKVKEQRKYARSVIVDLQEELPFDV